MSLEVVEHVLHHFPVGLVVGVDEVAKVHDGVANVPSHGAHDEE